MNRDEILKEVSGWPLAEQLRLLEAIWAVVLDDNPEEPELGRAERELLMQRLAEDDVAPDDVIAWDDMKSEIAKRQGR